jgi:hypothetical protein
MANRYYLHGDPHETLEGSYYCKRCDLFIPSSHFATCRLSKKARHGKLSRESNGERYRTQLRTLARHAGVKKDPNNLFAVPELS